MRISDRYIGKQVLWSTVFAIIVLSLVLVLGSLFQQIRPLLVEQKIPFGMVGRFALNILPFSMMFTIPWGFLSAVLLVFGRLSSEQELTGFRVAGISLPRLSAPVFVLALALSGLCMWLNVRVAPKAKASLDDMIYKEVMRDPKALLDPGAVQSRFSNQKVFVEAKDGDALVGFHMYQTRKPNDPNGPTPAYIHARRVDFQVDQARQQFALTLDGAYFETKNDKGEYQPAFTEDAKYWFLNFSDSRPKKPRSGTMTEDEIHAFLDTNPKIPEQAKRTFLADITKRYSFSMACLAFAFVGVPLGLKARRQDTSTGLILSMLIAAGYFLSTFVADQFRTLEAMKAALWAPNVLCVILGLVLFRRARFR
ncbi:LptF/LptG family permease [Luteolibacter sp. LG18]|uniref:LptF/LptG family permease n=1 Tax=Luteolibacter sp. LG18 TaxID=2819286 RepID=UPI002B2FAC23|nr:LPS export ABC transporter permease LptF [Luteolibacter sp. LG18]